jgi:hypothetical protein
MEKENNYNNPVLYIIGGVIIIVLVIWIIIVNINYPMVCNFPYINDGKYCCIDQNSNKICDNDEMPIPKGVNTGVAGYPTCTNVGEWCQGEDVVYCPTQFSAIIPLIKCAEEGKICDYYKNGTPYCKKINKTVEFLSSAWGTIFVWIFITGMFILTGALIRILLLHIKKNNMNKEKGV